MEKTQFVNFIVTILEKSGFKVYKNFKTFQHVIDVYAVLPTIMGDFTVLITCKNYDKEWTVGLDIVKEMELVGRTLKASKVVVATTSNFSPQAKSYASEKKIKLLDRDHLVILAKKISKEPNHNGMENSYYKNEEKSYPRNETIQDSNDDELKIISKSQEYPEQSENKVTLKKKEIISQKPQKKAKISIFRSKTRDNSKTNPNSGDLHRIKEKKPKEPLLPKIIRIANNTTVLISLVVAISYLISFIVYRIANVSVGVQGLIKIFSSLLLSYGLVFIMNPEKTVFLLKGTLVFFVSLFITILMIIYM